MGYLAEIDRIATGLKDHDNWRAINPEYVARMQLQNRFRDGIEIAQYTADIMRKDMARYDADPSQYTQSLGAWHGFIAQQEMMSVKRHLNSLDRRYIYLSGWMVAALRSKFGPLPDQSMHEKTTVPESDSRRSTHFCVKPMPGSCATYSPNWTKRGPMAAT